MGEEREREGERGRRRGRRRDLSDFRNTRALGVSNQTPPFLSKTLSLFIYLSICLLRLSLPLLSPTPLLIFGLPLLFPVSAPSPPLRPCVSPFPSFLFLSLSLSTIGFDAFESRKASSNLCRSRWRGGVWKVSSIYSHGRNDREGKIRERERRIDPTMDHDGRKWRDFGGWLKTCERKSRGKEGRKEGRIVCWSFAILIHDYRSSCLLSRESALSLSLSLLRGFLPSIPRRIVFFSAFCCDSLSPRFFDPPSPPSDKSHCLDVRHFCA